MKVYFEPIDKYTLDYVFTHRIDRKTVSLDTKKYKKLFLDNSRYIHTMVINNTIIGITGFIPEENGLAGYLVLTDAYKRYPRLWLREAKKHLKTIDAPIYFEKHHNNEYTNRWYRLMGFEYNRDTNLWIRR